MTLGHKVEWSTRRQGEAIYMYVSDACMRACVRA